MKEQQKITIEALQDLCRHYYDLERALVSINSGIEYAIKAGIALYNHPVLLAQFPSSAIAFKEYLLAIDSSIKDFQFSLPKKRNLYE